MVVVEASVGGVSAKEKTVRQVERLCELYPSDAPPVQLARHTKELSGVSVAFYPGKFLDRIRPEWLAQGQRRALKTLAVRLTPRCKAKIERLPWFAAWRRLV